MATRHKQIQGGMKWEDQKNRGVKRERERKGEKESQRKTKKYQEEGEQGKAMKQKIIKRKREVER